MNDTPFYLAEDFSGPFPDTKLALTEHDGLLAVGGNLKPDTLLQAYSGTAMTNLFSGGHPIHVAYYIQKN